jgi:hypothetical protein
MKNMPANIPITPDRMYRLMRSVESDSDLIKSLMIVMAAPPSELRS